MHYKFNVKLGLTSIKSIQTQLKKNSNLFVNQLVPNLYNNATTLLLGFLGGTAITGAYGVLRKITNLLENILGIISNAFFPAINRDQQNTKTYRKVQWTISLFLIVSIAVGSPFILEFFNVENESAVLSLIILLAGIVGLTMYDIYATEPPEHFSKRLKLPFTNYFLLSRALTHRSYLNENKDAIEDNERLEFLGDAVLDFIVADWLYNHYPEKPEGDLTRLRAALVHTDQLADFAKRVDLGSALRLGRGEIQAGGRERLTLLCDAFEALIGALFIHGGIPAVNNFMKPSA